MYLYQPTTLDQIRRHVENYAAGFPSPADSFWEEHVLKARYFTIKIDSDRAGFFGIFEDKLLVQFVMDKEFLRHCQPVFADVISAYKIEEAFAPTCDELLMSLCLDAGVDMERQAYFFQDSQVPIPREKLYARGTFGMAAAGDMERILERTGDFFDRLEERIAREEIFVWEEAGDIIGAGIVERGEILSQYASIGMFTHPDCRQRGIGRSILVNLKGWCYDNGYIPIAGCWYYNHNSKRTLESAGMITKTRLIRFKFFGVRM